MVLLTSLSPVLSYRSGKGLGIMLLATQLLSARENKQKSSQSGLFLGCLPHTPVATGAALISPTVTQKGHWVKPGPEPCSLSAGDTFVLSCQLKADRLASESQAPRWRGGQTLIIERERSEPNMKAEPTNKSSLLEISLLGLSDSFSIPCESPQSPLLFPPILSPPGIPPPESEFRVANSLHHLSPRQMYITATRSF